jgi:phenylacetate-CoA ligase
VRADRFFFKYCVYLPATWIRGQNVAGHLGRLRKSESIAPAERRKLQEVRLARLLKSARSGVPEYSRRLARLPSGNLSLRDLGTIPPLTKQDVRDLHEELHHTPRPHFVVAKTTGGSTGEPVTIHKTHAAMAWELAATWRGYAWAGVHMGDLQARFWGVPLSAAGQRTARLTDFICHRHRFSAFDFDRDSFEQYDRQLRRNPPDYFYGYVSMIAELARWYSDTGRRLDNPPGAVITTSEVLSPDDRSAIETAFGCRVFNEYGCGELGTIAHECEHGRLHTSDENMIIEILDGDHPCRPGEKGEIVVTELNNIAMPLIRYRTGDFGSLSDESCPCGRTLGVLSDVFGRAYDFIVAPDGRRFHAEFLVYIFEEAQRQKCGIAQFRVEQTAPDHLHLLVVPSESGFPEQEELRLVARIRELLGANMRVTTSRVQRIQREASGKMRVIVGLETSSPRQAPVAPGTAELHV